MSLVDTLKSKLLKFFCLFSFNSLIALTLEEKIGQLFIVHFHGDIANEEAKELIQNVGVGGIIYYNWSNSLSSKEQVADLSKSLQSIANIPLFIAIDQEGGLVQRLKQGFSPQPSNWALGATHHPELAFDVAISIGRELQEVGINFNLAPVVDIADKAERGFIVPRTFSSDPLEVATFARCALEGYKEQSIIAVLKHFPGLGDALFDPHEHLPLLLKSLDELEQRELLPYRMLKDCAKAIMTAHILIPSLDPYFPITLSKDAIGFLREKIGFSGIIMTDSLMMEGLLQSVDSIEEAAIKSLIAGHDLLLFGGKQLEGKNAGFELTVQDIKRIKLALVKAVNEGEIPLFQIDQSLKRILELKNELRKHPYH